MKNKKYKVCVYGICKNEEKFAKKWCEQAKEADLIIAGDTGSNDKTIEILKNNGAIVYILDATPFRYDDCRNQLLEKIPEDVDICVSMDFDDELNQGWRLKLEEAWQIDTNRASCQFNWSHNKDGSPAISYPYQRIHSRKDYKWCYPTHEVVKFMGKGIEKGVFVEGMVIDNRADKTKDRTYNLELLELAVKENPNSSRNLHYLGREYMFMKKWHKCILTLKNYLALKTSTWKEERSASMRFIARAYKALKDYENARIWLYKAMAETPNLREPFMEFAILAHEEGQWLAMYYYSNYALSIKEKHLGYVNESFAWDYTPYDLIAISSYYLGFKDSAIKNSIIAMKLNPDNVRLKNNHKFYVDDKNYEFN